MTRDIPLRERKPKKKLEEDSSARERLAAKFSSDSDDAEVREGYRECIELFALHSPNKQVGKILDMHCVLLENDCLRDPSRKNYARYEGYRQAMKDLKKRIK